MRPLCLCGKRAIKNGGDMKHKAIPNDIRKQAEEIVDNFNRKTFHGNDCYYVMRIQGKTFLS